MFIKPLHSIDSKDLVFRNFNKGWTVHGTKGGIEDFFPYSNSDT